MSECSLTQRLQCKLPEVGVCVLYLSLLSLLPFEGDHSFGRCSGLLASHSPLPSFVCSRALWSMHSLQSLYPKQARDALPGLPGQANSSSASLSSSWFRALCLIPHTPLASPLKSPTLLFIVIVFMTPRFQLRLSFMSVFLYRWTVWNNSSS